jgi:hypothetical protein
MNHLTRICAAGPPARFVTFALSLLAVLSLLPTVQAKTDRDRLGVSVTVLRQATVRTGSFPAELEISPADVKRGYVERKRATQLSVGNQSPVAIALDVVPTARIFSQIEVNTPRGRASLSADGGQMVELSSGGSADPVLLDLRFKLLPGVVPGRYAWPLRFDVRLDY